MSDILKTAKTAEANTIGILAKAKATYLVSWPVWVPVIAVAPLLGHLV